MNFKAIALAAVAASVVLPASASADFVGASILTVSTGQGVNSDLTTYRVMASFDNPTDILNGVGGAAGLMSLDFLTDDPNGLNNDHPVAVTDLFSPFVTEFDSYLMLGMDPGAVFSPNFLSSMGGDAGGMVGGTNWSVADDGYFKAGGVFVGVGDASLAQFVVRDGYGIAYSGTVGWFNAGGGGLTPFSVNNIAAVPTPGALALLGLAGLVGRRRRR